MPLKLDLNPNLRTLQQFGFLCLLFFGGFAGIGLYRNGPSTSAMVLVVLATAGGLAGWMTPGLLRPVFVGWSIAAFPIGWCVSHIVLALLFYGVFTPVGLLLRMAGKDPLQLRRVDRDSYWQQKPPQPDMRRYFRQY